MKAKGKPVSRELVFTEDQVRRTDAILVAMAEKGNPFAIYILQALASSIDVRDRAYLTAHFHSYASALAEALRAAAGSEEEFVAVLTQIKRIKLHVPKVITTASTNVPVQVP